MIKAQWLQQPKECAVVSEGVGQSAGERLMHIATGPHQVPQAVLLAGAAYRRQLQPENQQTRY